MELRFHGEVRVVRYALRIFAEADEESECVELRARNTELVELHRFIRRLRSGEDGLKDGEEVLAAELSECVPFGFRKFQDKLMPQAIRDVQRVNDGNVGQLALPFGSQSGGGAWSNRFASYIGRNATLRAIMFD